MLKYFRLREWRLDFENNEGQRSSRWIEETYETVSMRIEKYKKWHWPSDSIIRIRGLAVECNTAVLGVINTCRVNKLFESTMWVVKM